MAEALYRKYRPQVFEDVVGQEPIERTLKNAIRQDKVSHAYLFCGPRGTGKTTTARLLAKALICEQGPTPDPDGTCEDCRLIADGAHPDVYELDAASRTGVENVREEIISRVSFAPTRGRYKVYIIDEVHMLSTAAFNALLKTLEEPPSHVVFVLCTTDPQKVPETIHSRCQRFDFHRISPESMVARLGAICMAEEVEFEGEALDLIAQRADGGLRNALTSLEQIIAFENGKATLVGAERLLGSIDSNDMAEIVAYIGKRDIANCFRWTAAYVETGADLAQFVRDMSEHVRNLYVMALTGDDAVLDVSETARRELAGELAWFGPDRAARLLGVLGDLTADLKTTSNPRLAFEIALTRMVRPDSDLTLESLAERVEALESGYSAVAHVLPGQPYAAPHASTVSAPVTGGNPAPESSAPASAMSAGREAAGSDGRDAALTGMAQTDMPSADAAAEIAQVNTTLVAPSAAWREDAEQPWGDARSDGVSASAHDQAVQEIAETPAVAETPAMNEGDVSTVSQPGSVNAAQAQPGFGALANPASLQRIWQAALADVKKRKQAYGVLFMNTKAVFDDARGLVRVVFPTESSFAYNAVQKPDVQEALEEALAKAAGRPIQFCYEKGAGQAASPSQAAIADAASAEWAPRNQAPQEQVSPVQASPAQVHHGQASNEPTPSRQVQDESTPSRQASNEPAPSRQASSEQVPSEQVPSEQVPSGQAPSGPIQNEPANYEQVPYDEVPYEQVPYDDAYYEYVPYDEYQGVDSSPAPVNASPNTMADFAPQPVPDAETAPSPADAAFTPEGAVQEDAAALQAMLQASFGGGVVFSEADD